MDLIEALRTTGAAREFMNEPVDRSTLLAILDDARFAPSGGNRQAWHVIVVEDPSIRHQLRDLYLEGWHDYVAHMLAGLVPFSPLASEDDRLVASAQRAAAESMSTPEGFAERLDQVPAMLVVTADLSSLAAVDRDLGRYTIAGGASIYPFVWQIILAARARGLGGVMTTMATREEPAVRQVLGVPDHHAIAAVVVIGRPLHAPTRLTRRSVASFTTLDRFNGPSLEA
jgi:nitroreductase